MTVQISNRDLHQRITQQIITAIEAGAGNYQMPWNRKGLASELPQNPIGKYQYHGINVLSLWASQQLNVFTTGHWATYRQWLSIGAHVRKGEKGSPTVFYQPIIKDAELSTSVDGEMTPANRVGRPFIAKTATVFNADQVDGFNPVDIEVIHDRRHDQAEKIINNSGARILWGGNKACYLPSRDEIHLPLLENFISMEAYYGVAFHELVHWTGHSSRCARDLSGRFGSSGYAMEELVAELGAAYMSAEAGVDQQPRLDHARYIESWLDVLKNDTNAIFFAAARATEACRFLCSSSEEPMLSEIE